MILKNADDKSKRLAMLEELRNSFLIDQSQREWLRKELKRARKGLQGEKDSAHYLDNYFKDSLNNVILHDLRFVADGDVAQIDHLVINRGGGMYLIETKNYSGNLVINDHGEFTVEYGKDTYGIPSPIEQSRRHEAILARVLDRLGITGRLGAKIPFYHVVLLGPQAVITRPSAREFDTSSVIKADQFPTWHKNFVDKEIGVVGVLRAVTNARSLETIRQWGQQLVREHQPEDLMALPDFMKPNTRSAASGGVGSACSGEKNAALSSTSLAKSSTPSAAAGGARKLICSHCGERISFAEGKFCWNNGTRFGGLQYCRKHQKLF